MSNIPADLESCYARLCLSPPSSLEELDQVYFRLRAEKIRHNLRQEIPELKQAYQLLKAHLNQELASHADLHEPETSFCDRPRPGGDDRRANIANHLKPFFIHQGIHVQVNLSGRQLQIQLIESPSRQPDRTYRSSSLAQRSKIIAQVHAGLRQYHEPLPDGVQIVQIQAYRHSSQVMWEQIIPLPGVVTTFADHDLTSFQSRLVQLFGFPCLLLVAICMNAVGPIKFLLRGITIWFHEFGHATVAWLAGRKALPLPLGWTNVDPSKSLFVYGGLLILFGLMGWAGYRERRKWPMILAAVLMGLQFCMTWLMSAQMFEMLFFFGGIGGEFYLCTLLIVSFFFPLPNYFRWEIYRYPAVLGAAFTFFGSFWLWRQIDRGQQSIPWGTLWGGADHQGGDMNQLSLVYGWSDQQIIDTYNSLGGFCLGAILAVYFFFVWKNQRSHLFLFWHQLRASYWK